ncbi:MAG: efflux RND transporter periplasmic adaptor subunit [Bacteroidales bacterium]|nr:efflux RND transporter periplasmic adaptor subunit [Bacteroidales bacterium]
MRTRILLFTILIAVSAGCKTREAKVSPDEAVLVRVAPVTTGHITIPVHSTGTLVSSDELKLSFKTGGIIAGIYVKEGEHVKKGDLLASLNLSEINATAEQVKNGYEKALRDYKRAENLYRDTVVTLEQKQNALTALNVAQSAYEIVKFNLVHSKIFAPDNGIILRKLAKQNELIAAGYPVFVFGSSGKQWKVESGISDKDIVKVNPGDSASVSFDAWPGVKFPAVVDQAGEISNPYTGTYKTELLLNSTGYRLASGFVAAVDIYPFSGKSYTLIPIGSVVEADGKYGNIYYVTDSMSVTKIKIEIETLSGSQAAVKGIPEGVTEVVSEGAAYLKDGVKVKVIN